ncbi:TolC family protein [Longibacter salinarum]|uniref:TolC family protein n=1 Tax=Longibacter salinarum TaxID=1850348 RepID=UPI0015CEF7DD|nr:TolC family protein [Longibacter salinarum]
MSVRSWLIVLMTIALTGCVRAQDVRHLTPSECVEIALERHGDVRMADYRRNQAEAVYDEARTFRLPTFRVSASYRRLSSNVTTFTLDENVFDGDTTPIQDLNFDASLQDQYAVRGDVEQTLFSAGQTRSQIEAEHQLTLAQEHRASAVRRNVAHRVRLAYWSLVAAEASRDVARSARREVDEQLRVTRARYRQGMALRSDVLALEARASELRAEQRNADAAVASGRRLLSDRMGLDQGVIVRPTTRTFPLRPIRETTSELFAVAVAMRPDLEAEDHTVSAWRNRSRANRRARWPTISLVGSYVYARPNLAMFPQEDRFQGTWEVGVQMNVDLWDWNRQGHRAQQFEATWMEAREQQRQMRRRIRLQVADAVEEVHRSVDVLHAARERKRAAAEVFRVMRRRHAEGVALTTEVLSSERAYREARYATVEAEARYAQAHAGLDLAVGKPPSTPE